ncbi:MAG: Hsp70 family protein [Parachlamydiaceae bacterium]|nr:Hsp70 family protein [Parachlamydiaceae bacterium]
MSNYLIGIDFGTTNCTLAYVLKDDEKSDIQQFNIPQLVSPGTQGAEPLLPSFVYFPLPEELTQKVASLPWAPERTYALGRFAQERGAELPLQLISSPKSWLCHEGIDRRVPLLPLGVDSTHTKVSPLEACKEILLHLRESWEHSLNDAPFQDQEIYITVPASFDPSARQLVLEAAELANYPEVILLEEPQAAFYAWLHLSADDWRKGLAVGDHLLVIDIGGGTTDFSLISIDEENGNLQLNRTAVGAHLLLGGDNLDLSLAHLAKAKFEEQDHEIDDWQMQAIVQAARQAKEKLLSAQPPKSCDITIVGRGSRLIANTLKVELTKEEVLSFILDGFFPDVPATEQSKVEKHLGIKQIGLPYAQDPRVTSQLARFLSQMGEGTEGNTERFIVPKAVLFNGGTTKAIAIRERLLAQLNVWAKEFNQLEVKELSNADYDFGVSRGAVYYGMARSGKAIRIKSGISRSYFIGVEDAAPAVPGIETPMRAICVAPFGMEEGSEQTLEGQQFALVLGEQASFRFFSHATEKFEDGSQALMGTVVKRWKQLLTELHSIDARLDKGPEDGKTVQVKLKSKVTELGVLELWCVANDDRKWKLEFDIRKEQDVTKK